MLRMLVLKPSGIIPMHCNTLQRTATHCNRMQHMLRMLVSTPSDSILYQTFCREWRALSREYRAILGEYWARLKECRALSHIFSLHDSFGRVQGAFFYILFSTNPTFCFKRTLHSVSNKPYILFQTNPTCFFKQTLHKSVRHFCENTGLFEGLSYYVKLFGGNSGHFWENEGLFWKCCGLCWANTELFRESTGLFEGLSTYVKLFWGNSCLFWENEGLFGEYFGLFWENRGLFGENVGLLGRW